MEKEIEVVETTTTIEVGLRDQLIVTIAGAVVGLLASKLTEKAYFAGKARYQLARTKNTN